MQELGAGRVVIVAGFQGVTVNDDITTLGRGGGDITGAVLAAALQATSYENCTDVDGVYTADPRVVTEARRIPHLSYEECIELAAAGAKVLHPRAAEICMQYKVPIHVRHSFCGKPGTWVREGASMMERPSVVGVTTDRKIAKVTLLDVKDQPGIAAHVFRDLADAEINVRLIIQAAPAHERNRITFIIESRRHRRAQGAGAGLEEGQDRRPRRDRHRRRQDRHRRLAHRLDAGPGRAHVHGARRPTASTSTASARPR